MGNQPQTTPANQKLIVTATTLNVRRSPSLQGEAIGSLQKGEVVDGLATSEDGQWKQIQKGDLTGWASGKHLTPQLPAGIEKLLQIAKSSEIARYPWKSRGVAPAGYIKGMALVYARVYCKLKAGDPAAVEMAKANTNNEKKDALAHFADQFHDAGLDNSVAGVDTLRHLFVLLIGLGMRESSGQYCEGRDQSANNATAETAEAGLFQASFDARSASPLMPQLFKQYLANPSGFLDIFQEGVKCSASDLENFGSGDGMEFQRLTKSCPAFAAEFAAVGLRNLRTHWGPINRKEVEIRPECDAMLREIQAAVDAGGLCSALQ